MLHQATDFALHLSAIRASAQALLKAADALNDQQRPFVQHIARISQNLLEQLDGLPATEAAYLQVIPALGAAFRSPQESLIGYARMLLDHPQQFGSEQITETQSAQLETLYTHAIQLFQATDAINQAAFQQRQAQRQQSAAAFDLVTMLYQQAPLYHYWLKPYPVQLVMNLDVILPPAWGRPYHVDGLIRHVLMTLAAEPDYLGEMRLSAISKQIGRVTVELVCKDTQLSEEVLASLFQGNGRHLYGQHLHEDGGKIEVVRQHDGTHLLVHLQTRPHAL